MNTQWSQSILNVLKQIRLSTNKQMGRKLEINKWERVVKRLDFFSADCETCNNHLFELERYFTQFQDKLDHLDKKDVTDHNHQINQIISHLEKQHKLVTEGLYLSIYLSLGSGIGIVFGLLLLDNLALGIPFGAALGIAIGASLDADAKKKGLTF